MASPMFAVRMAYDRRADMRYTVVSHVALNDRRLNTTDKTVHTHLMSNKDGFLVSADRLAKQHGYGRNAIRTSFIRLEAFGYISRRLQRLAGSQELVTVFYVHEEPLHTNEVPGLGHKRTVPSRVRAKARKESEARANKFIARLAPECAPQTFVPRARRTWSPSACPVAVEAVESFETEEFTSSSSDSVCSRAPENVLLTNTTATKTKFPTPALPGVRGHAASRTAVVAPSSTGEGEKKHSGRPKAAAEWSALDSQDAATPTEPHQPPPASTKPVEGACAGLQATVEELQQIAREFPQLHTSRCYAAWVEEQFARYEQERCPGGAVDVFNQVPRIPAELRSLLTDETVAEMFTPLPGRKDGRALLDSRPVKSKLLTALLVNHAIDKKWIRRGVSESMEDHRLFPTSRSGKRTWRNEFMFASVAARLDSRVQATLDLCEDKTVICSDIPVFYKRNGYMRTMDIRNAKDLHNLEATETENYAQETCETPYVDILEATRRIGADGCRFARGNVQKRKAFKS